MLSSSRSKTRDATGIKINDSPWTIPGQPFEEVDPTSRIWGTCLAEGWKYDMDIMENQRGEVNVLFVFAGLFSAIVSAFIAQSFANLQPDYQQLSAYLTFDQINIQRAIANGTSLDRITTSGTDPMAPFTPKTSDLWINGLWFTSLTLSLATALFAILVDEWYYHYQSSVAGNPQVRSRTRHLRYDGLVSWRVGAFIRLLPLMLHLSLFLFFIGLVLSLLPQQQKTSIVVGIISIITFIVYVVTNTLPIIYPDCAYKTPLSLVAYVITTWILQQFVAVLKSISSLQIEFRPGLKTLQDFEMYGAEISSAKGEVDQLLWLYTRASTSAMRRLVIQALAGLPIKQVLY
ncbi:uncharacterized protein EV420DRAFT_1341015, partial [Desarmillaria tabescens]